MSLQLSSAMYRILISSRSPLASSRISKRSNALLVPQCYHSRRTLFNMFNKPAAPSDDKSKNEDEAAWVRTQLMKEMQEIMQEAQAQMMAQKADPTKNPLDLMKRMEGVINELEKTLTAEERQRLEGFKNMLVKGMQEAMKHTKP